MEWTVRGGSDQHTMTTHDELWIGLVELTGPCENPILSGSRGAYASYLTWCHDSSSFRAAAKQSAMDIALTLVKVHWAEPYRRRILRYELEDYIYNIAQDVTKRQHGLFGRFHVWEREDG